ncbi:MAG: complex I subunit 4 family protein [Ktedonobacterales bacterium]
MQIPILSVILFLPLAGAIGAIILPRMAGWGWAGLTALADLACCVWLITQFASGTSGLQFTESYPWLPQIGINYALGVDGINLFLLALNALLTLVALGASLNVVRVGDRSREYLFLMMLLSTGMMGVFLATNLFLFYVFWELMLVPAYLLVGMFGGRRRAYAAMKFVLYTAAGSLLMLVGIISVGVVVSTTAHTAYSLDLSTLLRNGVTSLPSTTQLWLFLAFAAAFAVKCGVFPFHSWAPDAYSEAPAPVAVLIAGVMAKTGAYGFIRFNLALFPVATRSMMPLMSILAVVGILYFALQALVATDLKRLVSYVSISHMSVIVLGIFALNVQGIEGGVLQMVNHGIVIAALFLVAAFIEVRTGTRRLADFGGLATRLPWLATAFMIAALAALGLPGLNSFAGEFLAFLGAFQSSYVFGALGTLVVIPAAWYMLRFFQGTMEGPPRDAPMAGNGTMSQMHGTTSRKSESKSLRDLSWAEFSVLLPLLALIVVLGIIPGAMTSRVQSSVDAVLSPASAAHLESKPAHNASHGATATKITAEP